MKWTIQFRDTILIIWCRKPETIIV